MSDTVSNAKEMAFRILRDADCDETSYQGVGFDTILGDLNEEFPDGIPGFSNEEIAAAIYEISTTDHGWKEPVRFEVKGTYASHWGVTDLYESVLTELSKLVESRDPFIANDLASKKELISWSIGRELVNGPISIAVKQWMDEGSALVDDALPEGEELSEEQIEEILDLYTMGAGLGFETEESMELPGESTMEDILSSVSQLADETDKTLTEWYETMKSIVQDFLGSTEDFSESNDFGFGNMNTLS